MKHFILLLALVAYAAAKCSLRDESTMGVCLKRGYQPDLENCQAEETDYKMKNKELKKCRNVEARLNQCGFKCDVEPTKPAPTEDPGPDPTQEPVDPTRPDKISKKCAHESINFYGTDIFNQVYGSVEDCIEDCLRTKNCKAVSYKRSTRTCYFKSQYGGAGPVVSADFTSVNMKCNRAPLSELRCQREGFTFSGADIKNFISTIEECVTLCRDTEGCKAFTFIEGTQRCYLKNKRGGNNGPTVYAGYTSVNMECDNSPVNNLNCLRDNINFSGAALSYLIVADEEECVRHCRDTEACVALTFIESNHYCYLKSKRGGNTGPTVSVGYRSMNMECDNSPVRNKNCIREGINFSGAALSSLIVADEEECVRHCRDTEACVALTFRESNHYCYLKSKRGGSTGPSIYAGYNSMNMECDNSPVRNLNCLRDGTNFSGAALASLIVADEEECVRHCRDTEACVALSFNEANHYCYLKSKRGGNTGPSVSAAYKSMNMECDNSPVRNLNCLREGINFSGAALSSLIVADEEECVRHCRDTEACVALSFNEANHYCYLKSKRGGYNGPSLSAGYNSMNMECDNSPVRNLGCQREGINFASAALASLIVADVEECVGHCRDTQDCVALTFRESNHYCYLKSKRGGSSGPSILAGYVSMNMECDNSQVKNLGCLRENVNFSGAGIGSMIVADEEECVRRCRDTQDCVAITFVESNHYCYYKSRRGGTYMYATAGYNSMNMECDNSRVNLQCTEEDDEFPGSAICSLVTDSMASCVILCRDMEGCLSISFDDVASKCYLKKKEFDWWEIKSKSNYRSTNLHEDC